MDKNLLRAFGKASAMNAFPSSQKIDIPVVADQWWNEYVAPADGFVSLVARLALVRRAGVWQRCRVRLALLRFTHTAQQK